MSELDPIVVAVAETVRWIWILGAVGHTLAVVGFAPWPQGSRYTVRAGIGLASLLVGLTTLAVAMLGFSRANTALEDLVFPMDPAVREGLFAQGKELLKPILTVGGLAWLLPTLIGAIHLMHEPPLPREDTMEDPTREIPTR